MPSASPFPASTATAGEGRVVAKLLPSGVSGIEKLAYRYPLKLITPPRPTDRQSVLVFLLSYGGGLVAGDQVALDIDVQAGARVSIVTQGYTKVFKSPSCDVVTRQELRVRIADDAALCLLPDPVQPFADSVYEQAQTFRLATLRSSLCMLDWVSQGRAALGEEWDFKRWAGKNEVWACAGAGPADKDEKDRLLVRDAIVLDHESAGKYAESLRASMQGNGVFGTLILRGPLMGQLGEFFLSEFAALPRLGARDFRTPEAVAKAANMGPAKSPLEKWRATRLDMERRHKVLWSAANVRGCVTVKFGAAEVEGGREWIGSMLEQDGSVIEHFGAHALLCLR
ncbi:hypothetical protein MCOR27_009160 [Pyricularia oryzae]|uniref:Urease accessory protein UreD n=5 Tax=Pyricularia TaxID=48558 RepID=A0ABQ8NBG3_PYRGI|nr:urease accessory protein UreD [Pyricularia oryzae 70-15]ELQ41314.1 urease accessory protein UreD [Pyricularia oryzae Y34]KAH8841973.1 hypothetical protein MCOR01_005915 [Pyricularia oryzae]KAI6293826.1 hypothetical protein MCOR33_008850 [Pyricularia grisea]EHA57287.1 urease accessory protein UreD [Pyricularia oryzae 70-15]KAH9435151.1 hypothetical protein MCOR02_004103 [Pyricularia oryzae]